MKPFRRNLDNYKVLRVFPGKGKPALDWLGASRAKDSRPHPDMGCPQCHGGFIILAHPHAQLLQAKMLGQFLQQSKMHGRLLIRRREAHKALYFETKIVAFLQKGAQLLRRHSTLLRLFPGIDLDQ